METKAMTPTEFLLARIAEDEARADSYGAVYAMHWPECDYPGDMPGTCTCNLRARVLAECEAKRRIVNVMRERHPHYNWMQVDDEARGEDRMHAIVGRILAAVYADHPDYRDEWRP